MSDVFEAISAAARREILDMLCQRDGRTLYEICVCLQADRGVGLTRQAVSQHLEVLEAAGLVRSQKSGRCKFHYLNADALRIIANRWVTPDTNRWDNKMKIVVTSVLVNDQDRALEFYTSKLGFQKKNDIPMGHHRWLTVVSPSEANGVELALEPDEHPAAAQFKKALMEDGIPYTSFGVDNIQSEYDRLTQLGVSFTQPPLAMGPVTTAVLDDTCGNLIQIAQRG